MPLLLLSNPVGASVFGELEEARAILKSATTARIFMIPSLLAKGARRKYHWARPSTSVKRVPGYRNAIHNRPFFLKRRAGCASRTGYPAGARDHLRMIIVSADDHQPVGIHDGDREDA